MSRVSKTDTDIEWTDTDTIFSNYPGYTDTDTRIFVVQIMCGLTEVVSHFFVNLETRRALKKNTAICSIMEGYLSVESRRFYCHIFVSKLHENFIKIDLTKYFYMDIHFCSI